MSYMHVYDGVPPSMGEIILAGPVSWPSLSAEKAVDRYLQLRPCIAYLRIKKKFEEDIQNGRLAWDQQRVKVDIYVSPWMPSRQCSFKMVTTYAHIPLQNEVEDIQSVYRTLRKRLCQALPGEDNIGKLVQVKFSVLTRRHHIFTGPWI